MLLAVLGSAPISASDPATLDSIRTGSFAPPKAFPGEVRIVDWNIARGRQLDRVAKTLTELEADICLLQELDLNAARTNRRDIARDLAQAVHMNYVFAPAFQELGQGKSGAAALHGQAILTTLPIRSSRMLRFASQTRFWKPYPLVPNWGIMQRRLGGRIALVVEFGASKTTLVVYNLHLESRGFGVTRMRQLREVLADARQYGPDVAVIIGGDLNTKYRPGLFESKLTAEGFQNCLGNRHVRTHVLIGALDWIFVRGGGACENARVVRGSKASDHDPIVAHINLRGPNRNSATHDGPEANQSQRESSSRPTP